MDVFLKLILNVLMIYETHNDYPLALDKIEIKRKQLSEYQLKIDDLYNILMDNVEKLMPYLFEKK